MMGQHRRLDAPASNADLTTGLDTFYLLFAGALVFLMQAGFAMLCAGSVRAKNVKNIMLKNILDACGGAVGFYLFGYAVAYGTSDKDYEDADATFIGDTNYWAMYNLHDTDYISWFFQFAFAATAATIVAGTVAERCKMAAYVCYSLFLTAFVYPIVVHTIWDTAGFLSAFNANDPLLGIGMVDFAGSGVVHMTGGATALIAAIILGPRTGRFYDSDGNPLDEPAEFQPHSVALQVLGTFILWFGWYGFNPGSTLAISPNGYPEIAALCAVTTTLAAACGCVSALVINYLVTLVGTGEGVYDLTMAMNGALSGLVGITAGCSTVQPWAAVCIGLIAGPVYIGASKTLVSLKIDDAVDAIPVHFANGAWGCIAVAIFADPELVEAAYGTKTGGILYGDVDLLGCEFAGVFFIIGWVAMLMTPFFIVLKTIGWFRVDALEEEVGLDISHHGGAAYDLTGPRKEDVEELVAQRSTKHGKVEAPSEA